MKLKGVVAEDFVNYKKPSLFLITCFCDWKCCHDGDFPESVCQNNNIINQPIIDVDINDLIKFYLNNPITKAIVFGGLEPFMQWEELYNFIDIFRHNCSDTIVIYTGYNKDEIEDKVNQLKRFENIVIKYGRYIPNHKPHYDEVLGVNLASDDQYAEIVSLNTKDITDMIQQGYGQFLVGSDTIPSWVMTKEYSFPIKNSRRDIDNGYIERWEYDNKTRTQKVILSEKAKKEILRGIMNNK